MMSNYILLIEMNLLRKLKSFGIELIKIEKVAKKKLDSNDLVKLAHCAIDIVIYKYNSAHKRNNDEVSTEGSNKKIHVS
jgi:hypothetical protein